MVRQSNLGTQTLPSSALIKSSKSNLVKFIQVEAALLLSPALSNEDDFPCHKQSNPKVLGGSRQLFLLQSIPILFHPPLEKTPPEQESQKSMVKVPVPLPWLALVACVLASSIPADSIATPFLFYYFT